MTVYVDPEDFLYPLNEGVPLAEIYPIDKLNPVDSKQKVLPNE